MGIITNGEQFGLIREKLNATLAPYASRAEFEAAEIPDGITAVRVIAGDAVLTLRRVDAGSWSSADGATWAPELRGGAVSLAALGYSPGDGDVRTLVATAAALSPTAHVIIPAASTPWISSGQWVISGITVEFEPGAKVAQNHAAVPGVNLQSGARLIRPWFTSTLYADQTLASVGAGGATTHPHNARAIWIEGDDIEILDVQMLEYMAGGIRASGYSGLKVTGVTAQYLRSYEGWAAAVDLLNCDDCYVSVNRISDCDRALEPEDGSTNIRFVAAPGIIERVWSRYYDQVGNPASESFCLSAHSHLGMGACRNIRYEGNWTLIDCASPIYFTQSIATEAEMPYGVVVEMATIVNTASFPSAYAARPQVFIDGHGCDVTFALQGVAGSPQATAQGIINRGKGNRLSLVGPDVEGALPWLDATANASGSILELSATQLTTQPTVPANSGESHLINVRGPNTEVRAKIHGVQNRGYVRLDSTARGSRIVGGDFIMPSSLGANAAIRFNGADGCALTGCSYKDTSGASQLVRMVGTSLANLIAGNLIERSAGNSITIDAGNDNNAIVNNMMGGTTINDLGAGNTKSNY